VCGYVSVSKYHTKVMAKGVVKRFKRLETNKGRLLANLAYYLVDAGVASIDSDGSVRIEEDVEELFYELITSDLPNRSGKAICQWLLAVWDLIKKYGFDKYLNFETLVALYV